MNRRLGGRAVLPPSGFEPRVFRLVSTQYTNSDSRLKQNRFARQSKKHGKEVVRAHNEVQLSNSKYGECIRNG